MNAIKDFIKNLGFSKAMALIGILVASAVFFIFLILRTSSPEMGLLFSQIDPADGAKILERLRSMNVPNEVRGEGGLIYVPADQIARLRMELAQDGLPAGGTIGYEIFDKTDVLGTTNALMDINYLRALEGELSKSVRTIQGVQSARVHLVMPKRELFSHEKNEPAASIILKMKGNSRLSVNQVQSIQHLIASAIPNLSIDKISIIDDKGTLLAKGKESTDIAESLSTQQEMKHAYETRVSRIIESLLEKTLGTGRARAEISAEMDFDKITSTSIEFNPDGQVVRSKTSSEDGLNSNETSNTDAVSIQNALPDEAQGNAGNQSKNQSTHAEENVNYEISNTTRTHIKETGAIKRLSIAVLVDGIYTPGENNKSNYAPRTQEELNQITDLVKTAVGFREDRGDTIKVINMRFQENEDHNLPTEQPNTWTHLFSSPKVMDLLIIGLIGIFFFLIVIRPVLKLISSSGSKNTDKISPQSTPFPSQPMTFTTPDGMYTYEEDPNDPNKFIYKPTKALESMINIENIDGRVKSSSIKKISEIIENHPEEAVAIMRSWLYADT